MAESTSLLLMISCYPSRGQSLKDQFKIMKINMCLLLYWHYQIEKVQPDNQDQHFLIVDYGHNLSRGIVFQQTPPP